MASNYSLYAYEASHVLPIVFAVLVGISLLIHTIQNFRYHYWRVTFFMFWGGAVFTTGWILRAISSHQPSSLNLYIAETLFIYAAPPIYAASEYNILERLLHYLPMHAPLNPNRVLIFFIYLGLAVEVTTAIGASYLSSSKGNMAIYQTGGTLISVGLVLQAVVECCFTCIVAYVHHQCERSGMLSSNVRTLCIMLYGTSILIMLRCIFRAIEAFAIYPSPTECSSFCLFMATHEWLIYAFEAAPMVLFTYWLNLIHPGRFLPSNKKRYLDQDGKTERLGPGWIDKRSMWQTFADPFEISSRAKGESAHEKFWLQPEEWPACEDGSFALGSATNVTKGAVNSRRATKETEKV